MSDYVIHAKLKNNNLLSKILEMAPSVNAWCLRFGFKPNQVGELINLKAAPTNAKGEWRLLAVRISEALGVSPEELWIEEQATARLRTNAVFIEMSRQQALAVVGSRESELISEEISQQVRRIVFDDSMSSRERQVIRLRFYEDKTLTETAKDLGVTLERARQIESRALNKLRYQRRTDGDDGLLDAYRKLN